MNKRKVLETIKNFLVLSAITHILIVFIYSVIIADFSLFNFFKFLGLDLFFPRIVTGTLSHIVSFLIVIDSLLSIHFIFVKR